MMHNMIEKTALLGAGLFLAVFLLAPASARAEDQAKDRPMVGPQTEMQKAAPSHGTPRSESMTGELSKATETPMKAPEGGEGLSAQPLIMPTISDFHDARESDRQSELAF